MGMGTAWGTFDHIIVVIPIILLLVDTPCQARPRHRFCERFPFAPRCLGVAAKRSPSRTDIYTSLINRALEEAVDEDLGRQTIAERQSAEFGDIDDRKSTLNKLASIILDRETSSNRDRNVFSDADDPWSIPFVEYETSRQV